MRTQLSAIAMSGILAAGGLAEDLDLNVYLPKANSVQGGLFRVGAAPNVEAISRKIDAAMKGKQEWLNKYLEEKKLKAGEILPYHENFGVTEAEYQVVVDAIGKLQLVRIGDVTLGFARNEAGVDITIEGKDLPLRAARIMLKEDYVQTHRMKLKERVPIDQNDPASPTGRWSGVQWRHLQGRTLETRFSEKFAIGRLKDKEEGIIYYDLRAANLNSASMVILYKLK